MEGDAPVSSQPSSQLTSGGGQRTLLDVWPCSRPGIDAAVRTRTFAGRAASAKRRSTAAADGGVDARAPAGAAAAAADAGAPEPLVAVDDPRLEDRVVLDAHALTFLSAPGRGGAHVLNDDSIVVVLSCGASSTTGVADTCAGPPPARGALRLPDTWLRVCAGDVLVLRDAATGGQRVVLEGARAEDRDDGGGCSGTAESRPARLLCVEAEVAGAPRRGTLTAGPQPGVVLFWCGKSAPRPTLVAVGPDLGCSLAGLLSPQHRPMRLTETSAEDVEPGRAAFAPGSHGDGVAGVLPIYVDELCACWVGRLRSRSLALCSNGRPCCS